MAEKQRTKKRLVYINYSPEDALDPGDQWTVEGITTRKKAAEEVQKKWGYGIKQFVLNDPKVYGKRRKGGKA